MSDPADRGVGRLTRRELVLGGLASAALTGIPGGGRGSGLPSEGYDVCVIGSGFAGIYLALRTSAARLRTVVLEAAPADPVAGDLVPDFPFESSGEIEYPVNATRMIASGGTSNLWAGVVNRLRPSDFRMHSEFGSGVDWPIDYADLEPYYCEAEQALSVQGRAPVEGVEPPRSCDYPYVITNPYRGPRLRYEGRELGFFRVARSMRKGRAVRLAEEEVPRFAASEYGTLLPGHRVTRLVSLDGGTIDHVVARSADGSSRRISAKVFVVAAGVVESTRLLLLARTDAGAAGPENDWLGRMFVEHPNFELRCRGLGLGPLNPGSYRTYDFNDAARQRGLNAYHYQLAVGSRWVTWKLQPEIEPRRENRITLSASARDRFGDPIPNLHFGYSERDRKTFEHARVYYARQARKLGTGPRGTDPIERWRAHPSGTCRMGFDEKTGVVDRDNRVMGTRNLYVSGACVFPSAGTANPTLTVVAMTLRLGDHLIARAGRGASGAR